MKRYFFLVVMGCLLVGLPSRGAEPDTLSVCIAKYKDDKECALSYTFDDGLREQYTLAFPYLEKYGFKGTFWINGAKVNRNEEHISDTTQVSWDNLREMDAKGHEISSHGWAHRKLTRISPEEALTEIERNDSVILCEVGKRPLTFCYPYNARNVQILRMASRDRVDTRTRQFALGGRMTAEALDRKVEELLKKRDWGVAMTHGISYGYDAFAQPGVFWEHLRKVKALEERIWVDTFCEVAAYVKEREAAELIVVAGKGRLTLIPRLFLNKELYTVPLTVRMENKGFRKVVAKQGHKKLEGRMLPEKILFDFDPFGEPIQVKYK